MKRVILASNSPRRRELLAQIGVKFEILAMPCDESLNYDISFEENVKLLAFKKAKPVYNLHNDAIIIAADTMVCIGDKILGKPKSREEAFEMLFELSDNVHKVITGVCVINEGKALMHCESTLVTFDKIDEKSINDYIDSGDCFDKAGAYGIQGYMAQFIPKIEGCYFNVMGLPLSALRKLI